MDGYKERHDCFVHSVPPAIPSLITGVDRMSKKKERLEEFLASSKLPDVTEEDVNAVDEAVEKIVSGDSYVVSLVLCPAPNMELNAADASYGDPKGLMRTVVY